MGGEGRGPCLAGEPQRPPPRSQPTAGLGAGFRPYVADEEAQDERRVVDFVARVSSVVSGGGFQTQVRCPSVDGVFRLGARLLTRQQVVIARQALSQLAVPSYPDGRPCGGAPGRVFLTLGACSSPGRSSEGPCTSASVGAGRGPSVSVPFLETTAELLGDLAASDHGQVRPEAPCVPRAPAAAGHALPS